MGERGTSTTSVEPSSRAGQAESDTEAAPDDPSRGLGTAGLAVALIAQLVVVLDFSIVNVALPDISRELGRVAEVAPGPSLGLKVLEAISPKEGTGADPR